MNNYVNALSFGRVTGYPTDSHVVATQFCEYFRQKFKPLSNGNAQRGQNNLNVFAMRPNKMPIVRNSTLITSDCELLLLSFFVVVVILLLHWELTSEQANQIGIKRPQPHATAACGG